MNSSRVFERLMTGWVSFIEMLTNMMNVYITLCKHAYMFTKCSFLIVSWMLRCLATTGTRLTEPRSYLSSPLMEQPGWSSDDPERPILTSNHRNLPVNETCWHVVLLVNRNLSSPGHQLMSRKEFWLDVLWATVHLHWVLPPIVPIVTVGSRELMVVQTSYENKIWANILSTNDQNLQLKWNYGF